MDPHTLHYHMALTMFQYRELFWHGPPVWQINGSIAMAAAASNGALETRQQVYHRKTPKMQHSPVMKTMSAMWTFIATSHNTTWQTMQEHTLTTETTVPAHMAYLTCHACQARHDWYKFLNYRQKTRLGLKIGCTIAKHSCLPWLVYIDRSDRASKVHILPIAWPGGLQDVMYWMHDA